MSGDSAWERLSRYAVDRASKYERKTVEGWLLEVSQRFVAPPVADTDRPTSETLRILFADIDHDPPVALHVDLRDRLRKGRENMPSRTSEQAYIQQALSLAGVRRDDVGRLVREVWVEWALQQPEPKASWLRPWEELTEPEREVDRLIGERLFHAGGDARLEAMAQLEALQQAVAAYANDPAKVQIHDCDLERVNGLLAAMLALVPPHLLKPPAPSFAPICPGEHCLMCNGQACLKCGAGCYSTVESRGGEVCEHDVCERHEVPRA